MRVIVTEHAMKRLKEDRQKGITVGEVSQAARNVPGQIPTATRFRGYVSKSGHVFDIVAKDIFGGRLVITVIGK